VHVRLTPSAERDLDEIEAYIATDNPAAAIDTVLRVIDSLAHLGEHPEIGRAGRIAGTREWVIPKTPFIAAYRISGKAKCCASCTARESGRNGCDGLDHSIDIPIL
jgi:toxin ParE1/3/4